MIAPTLPVHNNSKAPQHIPSTIEAINERARRNIANLAIAECRELTESEGEEDDEDYEVNEQSLPQKAEPYKKCEPTQVVA